MVKKNWGVLLRNHELLEKNELKNKGLQERIIILDEELEATRQLAKVSEEQMANLRETTKKLSKELSLIKGKSSEVEKLLEENKEEKAMLVARCDQLEAEARLLVECPPEVPPEVLKKMKEDYLASEEFCNEKIECATDAFFQGFNECVRQIKELDPNFTVAQLKRSDKAENEEEEEKEWEGETRK